MTISNVSKALGLTGVLAVAAVPACGDDTGSVTGDEQDVSSFVTDTFATTALAGGCSVHVAKTGKVVKTKGSGGACPTTVTGVLDALEGAKHKLHVFVVSEEGDLTPGAKTPYRFVIAVDTGDGKPEKLFLSVLGSGAGVSEGFMEVMSFNEKKGVYAYYDMGDDGWIQEGDGSMVATDALSQHEDPAFRCQECHKSGQPLMKELHDSWANWNSTWFSMPDPSGLQDKLLTRLLRAKERADDLELFVIAGTKTATKTRVDKAVKEKKLKPLLTQLMCDVGEPSLIAAHSKNSKRTETVQTFSSMLPSSILLNNLFKVPRTGSSEQKGMDKLLDMNLPSLSSVRIDAAAYVKALETIGQTIGGGAGDAMFPMASPEKSFADIQVVQELASRGLLDKDIIADALMTDFTVSTFSSIRCDLAETIPTSWTDAADLRTQWAASLGASSIRGAQGLKARLEAPEDFSAHESTIDAYLKACNERGTADKDGFALDVLKVVSQRRVEFSDVYASVIESAWLIPDDALGSRPHASRLSAVTCTLEAQSEAFVGEGG